MVKENIYKLLDKALAALENNDIREAKKQIEFIKIEFELAEWEDNDWKPLFNKNDGDYKMDDKTKKLLKEFGWQSID